jgi:hypothetical protein
VENWKGTTLSFILHYQEQIQLYDQLQPPPKQTSDHVKMIYLQNAGYVIEELRLVQTTGSQPTLTLSVSAQKKRIGYIKTSTIKSTALFYRANPLLTEHYFVETLDQLWNQV